MIEYFASIGVKKALAGIGCLGASYIAWRTLPEPRVRSKAMSIFKAGDICIKKKRWFAKNETKIFPTIHAVKIGRDKTDIVFSVPFGLNPDEVTKKQWLFQQKFGTNIELSRDNARFFLTVHHHKLPKEVKYDFAMISEHMKGLRLPIVSGQTKEGFVCYDMVQNPHLLIAGETGSGKSTQLRAILSAIIQAKQPEDIELYLADLKRSEFHLFKRVHHVKDVVITSTDLYRILTKLKREMVRRGNLLDRHELTHIDDLPKKLPYIVLCIDEVALLKKEKDSMAIVEDISAIGRSLGVFLILSMQRPDSEVLDGKLKNNLTVRMAFRHSDEINSRITIGTGEAASIKISDRGRMYFKHEALVEAQGPFLDAEDAKVLLESYKALREAPSASEESEIKEEKVFGVLSDETA